MKCFFFVCSLYVRTFFSIENRLHSKILEHSPTFFVCFVFSMNSNHEGNWRKWKVRRRERMMFRTMREYKISSQTKFNRSIFFFYSDKHFFFLFRREITGYLCSTYSIERRTTTTTITTTKQYNNNNIEYHYVRMNWESKQWRIFFSCVYRTLSFFFLASFISSDAMPCHHGFYNYKINKEQLF